MEIDTLVIGGGQAGLSTSYWLSEAGVEHLVVDGREDVGGAWLDRWDSFRLVAPNFIILLPGMPYDGPDPDGFGTRLEIIQYLRDYAAKIDAPLRLGTRITRLAATGDGRFEAFADGVTFVARNVVLATGGHAVPYVPDLAAGLDGAVTQLHSDEYRRPSQLPAGGVLVVGTGQSGAQLAEELHAAGRAVHVAVSRCPSIPRRYRGKDLIYWLLNVYLHGDEVGVPFPTVADLPTPAARFGCIPHVSGQDGGHDLDLRDFARRGMRLYGQLESVDGQVARFSDDLGERLAMVDSGFDDEFRPLFDAYIAAAGIDAPADDRPPKSTYLPETSTSLDLAAAGVSTVLWATGYRLDFSWVELPVMDEWAYPLHDRGVVIHPGLYAIGLPWLHTEASSALAGVGADAEHIVRHLVSRSDIRSEV